MEVDTFEAHHERALNMHLQSILNGGTFDLLIELYRRSAIKSYSEKEEDKPWVHKTKIATRSSILDKIALHVDLRGMAREWQDQRAELLSPEDREAFMANLGNNEELLEYCKNLIRLRVLTQLNITNR